MRKISNKSLILIIIFLFIAVKQVIFTFVIPPWQNHDEPAHFHYTQYIVEEKKLPIMEGERILPQTLSFSEEYAVSEQLTDATRLMTGSNKQLRNVHQRFQANLYDYSKIKGELSGLSRHPILESRESAPQYKNMYYHLSPEPDVYHNSAAPYQPLYYILEAIPYKLFYNSDIITRLYAMRLFSNLFYLGTITVCYLIARRLIKNFKFSITLTLIVGLLPVFSHLMTGLNNDALLILMSTLAIYWYIRLIQRMTWQNSLWLGVTLGLGMLSKPHFAVLVPLALIPYIYHWFKNKELKKIKIIYWGLIALAVMILLSGWWFIWNYQHYGSFIFQNASIQNITSASLSFGAILWYYFYRWLYGFASYYYAFGFSTEMIMPLYIVVVVTASCILAILGLIKFTIQNWKKRNPTNLSMAIILILPVLLLEIFFLYLFSNTLFSVGHARFPIDGRYYLPAVFSLTFLWLLGLWSLLPQRFRKFLLLTLICIFLLINAVAIFNVIIQKFYL